MIDRWSLKNKLSILIWKWGENYFLDNYSYETFCPLESSRKRKWGRLCKQKGNLRNWERDKFIDIILLAYSNYFFYNQTWMF